jgi:hypothetical protein
MIMNKAQGAASADQRQAKRSLMPVHKFKVGQTLQFSPNMFENSARKGSYTVVRLLPAENGCNQYRIKSFLDGHERVVREDQLI